MLRRLLRTLAEIPMALIQSLGTSLNHLKFKQDDPTWKNAARAVCILVAPVLVIAFPTYTIILGGLSMVSGDPGFGRVLKTTVDILGIGLGVLVAQFSLEIIALMLAIGLVDMVVRVERRYKELEHEMEATAPSAA